MNVSGMMTPQQIAQIKAPGIVQSGKELSGVHDAPGTLNMIQKIDVSVVGDVYLVSSGMPTQYIGKFVDTYA